MTPTPEEQLKAWFQPLTGSLTAFSGGVDSALVLYLSRRYLGANGVGVIADSPSLKRQDLAIARDFCRNHDINLRIIKTRELENPDYAANPANRCFHCKSTLYTDLLSLQDQYPGHTLLNGTNADDFGDYRPGIKAAELNSIRSPLAECGLGKSAIRDLARQFNLEVWDKPASPCLSSRIPYGQVVTAEKLGQIEAAELILGEAGFAQVRVRHLDGRACIEVPVADLPKLRQTLDTLAPRLQQLGFSSVDADEEGLVSGKLNRAIL